MTPIEGEFWIVEVDNGDPDDLDYYGPFSEEQAAHAWSIGKSLLPVGGSVVIRVVPPSEYDGMGS